MSGIYEEVIEKKQEEISGTQTPGERVIIYSLAKIAGLLERVLEKMK